MQFTYQRYLTLIIIILNLILSNQAVADTDLISLFPLDHYNQAIDLWLNPKASNYDEALLDAKIQQQHTKLLRAHYFGVRSPWNAQYVTNLLQQTSPNDLKSVEQEIIQWFDNEGKPDSKIGYGANFRPYPKAWIEQIRININLNQFDSINYDSQKRAIAIRNLHGRVLPTEEVHFFNPNSSGQGYPFDNLQMSSVWIGTPLYVLATTQDGAWDYILTPDFITWVPSDGVAYMNQANIHQWQAVADKQLAAIVKTRTPLKVKKQPQRVAYVGTLLPMSSPTQVLVPYADAEGQAKLTTATVSADAITTVPLPLTRRNIARVVSTLINRPYGWGGMYFYNDCSAELKSVFTPFGIYLPRHSSDQVTVGKMVDLSPSSAEERLQFLMQRGKPFLNVVYIGGHTFLYIGNYKDPDSNDPHFRAMTYQNIWGLRPNPTAPERRAVIGQSVFFPLLMQYPEDPTLAPLVNKEYFQVAFLDALQPNVLATAQINLRKLAGLDSLV